MSSEFILNIDTIGSIRFSFRISASQGQKNRTLLLGPF